MRETSELKDLLMFRAWWRFWKKGMVVGLLTGLVTWLIDFILSAVNGGIPMNLSTMAQFGMLSGKIIIAVTIAWIVYGIVAGFVVEYVNNGKSAVLKWVNK